VSVLVIQFNYIGDVIEHSARCDVDARSHSLADIAFVVARSNSSYDVVGLSIQTHGLDHAFFAHCILGLQ